jgi:alpha-tubulin suppressor-like RCC1 family protein/outer membrane protein assembly factor BamB
LCKFPQPSGAKGVDSVIRLAGFPHVQGRFAAINRVPQRFNRHMNMVRSLVATALALFSFGVLAQESTNVIEAKWQTPGKPRLSSPALSLDETIVYAGGSDGVLYGFDVETGDQVIAAPVGGGRLSAPLIGDDGNIYVATSGGLLICVEDPTVSGARLWRYPENHAVSGGMVGSPVIDEDGVLYIGSRDNRLHAVDSSDGTLLWTFRATRDVTSSPTIAPSGDVVFAAGNTVVTLSPDGDEVATFIAGSTIRSTPAVGEGGVIYFGAKDDLVYAITGSGSSTNSTNSSSSDETWQVKGGGDISSSPAIGVTGRIFIGTDAKRVLFIDPDGVVRKANVRGAVRSEIAIGADGTVYVGADNKTLYALNPQTRAQKWRFIANGPVRCSPVIDSFGVIYITVGKTITAIDPGDDVESDEAPWPQFRRDAQHTARATQDQISISQQPQSLTVSNGETAKFEVVASAASPLTYQWTFNGADILKATNATLIITNAQFTNAGVYAVEISNDSDSVTSDDATLIVNSVPVITADITNHFVSTGSDLRLEVSATGNPPLAVQWHSNGVAIPGATNLVFVISNAQPSSAAAYDVTIQNTNGSAQSRTGEVTVVTLDLRRSTSIAIGAGNQFSAAVISNQLFTWGTDTTGQLADGGSASRNVPTRTNTETNWLFVSAGGRGNTNTAGHAVALKTDGSMLSWGANSRGQLGIGNTTDSRVPTIVSTDTNWIYAEAGALHSVALRGDGTIWTWGANDFGQLGFGNTNNVSVETRLGVDSGWIEVRAGGSFMLARRADGTLWGWGRNDSAQLGNNTTANALSPIQIGTNTDWAAISAGVSHSMGVRSNGTLWVWGRNFGLNTTRLENSTNIFRVPTQVGSETNWVAVDAGFDHSLMINSAGQMFAWGANQIGQLGNGSSGATIGNTNDANLSMPMQIAASRTWAAVEAGVRHSLARATDNTIWAWGWNNFGQVGDGTGGFGNDAANRTTPVLLTFTNFVVAPTNSGNTNFGPTVTQQPTNTSAGAGGTATFTMNATGSPPIAVQWFFNTSNAIEFATNFTLTITNVQATNAGTYHARVTNSFGTASSAAATLTVTNSSGGTSSGGETNTTSSPPPVPRMAIASPSTNGVTIPVSNSSSTQRLVLEFKTLMSDAAWTPISTNQGSAGVTNLVDPSPTNGSRFYRLRVE